MLSVAICSGGVVGIGVSCTRTRLSLKPLAEGGVSLNRESGSDSSSKACGCEGDGGAWGAIGRMNRTCEHHVSNIFMHMPTALEQPCLCIPFRRWRRRRWLNLCVAPLALRGLEARSSRERSLAERLYIPCGLSNVASSMQETCECIHACFLNSCAHLLKFLLRRRPLFDTSQDPLYIRSALGLSVVSLQECVD